MSAGIASRRAARDNRKVLLNLCLVAAGLAGCGSPHNEGTVLPLGAAQNATTHSITFNYTGKKQIFKVPPNVTAIRAILLGGNGAGKTGAHAGRVSAVLPVTPGEKLIVFVGGNGSGESGGLNGGANGGENAFCCAGYGGGGASDVRRAGGTLSDRILVAGGGGGEGGIFKRRFSHGYGGKGGGVNGGAGGNGDGNNPGGIGGTGGTDSAGGIGGQGGLCQESYGNSGADGTLGNGGAGAAGFMGCAGGGGGGGGYYGGGGGGGGAWYVSGGGYGAGGGGGGSFYAEPNATDVHTWAGWSDSKGGLVVFHWS